MKPTRAVITGASSGIGEEFAKQLAMLGVNLVVVARRSERLEKLKFYLEEQHKITVEVFSLDLTEADAAEKLFHFATSNGEVDLLINNAGAGPYRQFLRTSLAEHRKIIDLNVTALTSLSHLFAAHMLIHKREAAILNVASVAAFGPVPRFAVYGASKAFVKMFSEALNYELQDTNVSVSCLCPGGTKTEFLEKNNQLPKENTEKFLMSSEAVAKAGLKGTFSRTPVITPGLFNKATHIFSSVMPDSISMYVTEKAMSHAVEERT